MNEFIKFIIPYIVGGGGVALVGALIKGWQSIRAGALSLERDAVASLAKRRQEAEHDLGVTIRDRDFWRLVSARYAAQLLRGGLEPSPRDPVPPSEIRNGQ